MVHILSLCILVCMGSLVYSRADLPFERPIFDELLSGDNFRSLADFILESNNPCHIEFYRGNLIPEKVQRGDIVFVECSGLGIFFKDYYHKIKHPFILITHNHDSSSPREFAPYLEDQKIIMWFGFNPTIEHKKFVGIPLGLSNRDWRHAAQHEMHIKQVLKERAYANQSQRKTIFLYSNFSVHTAPKIRQPVYDYFESIKKTPLGKKIEFSKYKDFKLYAHDLANAEFTISPQGSGMDCHRLWEALYLGCIPIVVDSSLTTMYSDFPIITVKRWEDITLDHLLTKKEEFKTKEFSMEKLYFPYWKDRILGLKRFIKGE